MKIYCFNLIFLAGKTVRIVLFESKLSVFPSSSQSPADRLFQYDTLSKKISIKLIFPSLFLHLLRFLNHFCIQGIFVISYFLGDSFIRRTENFSSKDARVF